MLNETLPPADTIELLLREIAAQLRRRADDNSSARRRATRVTTVLVVAAMAGCGVASEEAIAPPPHGPGVTVPSAPTGDRTRDKRGGAREVTRAGHVTTVYVQRTTGCHDDPHDSTAADPYCEIMPALPTSGRAVVHLGASPQPYSPVSFTGESPIELDVIGPGAADATVRGFAGPAVRLGAPHGRDVILALRGVTLIGGTFSHGADCGGKSGHAQLTLEDVVLKGSGGYGVFAFGCQLTVRRALVEGNGGGLALFQSRYALEDVTLSDNLGHAFLIEESEGTVLRVEPLP